MKIYCHEAYDNDASFQLEAESQAEIFQLKEIHEECNFKRIESEYFVNEDGMVFLRIEAKVKPCR